MAYETTSVSADKSQGDIRKVLVKYGATRFTFGEDRTNEGERVVAMEFLHDGYLIRMKVPLRSPDMREVKSKASRARSKTAADIEEEMWEQEAKRVWRVLFWSLKARMVAVEDGLETLEQAFLSHLVNPATGRTIWESLKPHIQAGDLQVTGRGISLPLALGAGDDD
jgi:hypothetical protein